MQFEKIFVEKDQRAKVIHQRTTKTNPLTLPKIDFDYLYFP